MTFPTDVTIPLLKDVKAQAPKAVCELAPTNVSTNLIINRDAPPFDNAEIRRAWRWRSTARRSSTSCSRARADRRRHAAAAGGIWGMPKEVLKTAAGLRPT